MLNTIVWILLGTILTVFLLLTVKMLFVFIKNAKVNKVINKSVLKQIYSGKLSFIIIMLFFAISFSLVGGAQILDTLASRSVLKQFTNYHLYQNQLKGNIFRIEDEVQNNAISYRNSLIHDKDKMVYNGGFTYVNPWLIDNTLSWYNDGKDYNHSNDRNPKANNKLPYWYLSNKKGQKLLDTKNLKPDQPFFHFGGKHLNPKQDGFFIDKTRSYGWTSQEYANALYLDFKHIFENSKIWHDYQIINNHKDSFQEFADKFICIYFGGKIHDINTWWNYGQMIAMLRVFDSYHPNGVDTKEYLKPFLKDSVSSHYYGQPDVAIARKNLKEYMKGLSYINTLYSNGLAQFSANKNNYEFVVKNNIDWATGKYLHENDDNPFVKTVTKNGESINATTYFSGIKSDKKFIEEAKRGSPSIGGGQKEKYNIIVQSEFLKQNNLKVGDTISFNNTTEFHIVANVKFNEVTYPVIGTSLISNMKHSAFVGINLTDFINLKSNNDILSMDAEYDSFYFGINNGYDRLNKLLSWTGSSDAFKFINKQVNYFNENITNATQIYKITYKKINELKKTLLNSGVNVSFWNRILVDKDNDYTFKSYYLMCDVNLFKTNSGFVLKKNVMASVNDMSTLPSIRAKLGVQQIIEQEKIINFLVIVFIIIVLIVISMQVTKRIKSSGKQLGTLKAMGMKNKSIASAYIIYPLIIILSGFIISSLVSIPVALILIHLMKGFYCITFLGNPLSLNFFLKMLLIPMVLSIGVTYIISIKTLKKPILDLLNNKNMNSPNIFVRALGYITPIKVPFVLTYTSKGFLRAIGKSSLLFLAIFISTFLVAFSLSSTTMLKKQTDTALKYLNLRSISKNSGNNWRKYAPRNEFVKHTPDKTNPQTWIESYKQNEKGIDLDLTMPFIFSKEQYNNFLDKAQKVLTQYGEDEVLFEYNGNLKSSQWKDGQPWHSNYYFTKNFMINITLAFMTAQKNIQFQTWESERNKSSSGDDKLIFKNLESMIESWIFTIYGNAVFNGDKIPPLNPDNISNWLNLIKKYGTDLTLNEQYYNQFQQYITRDYRLENYQRALNYKNRWDSFKKWEGEVMGKLAIMDSLDSIRNAFGAKGTNLGEDLYNKLKPYKDIIDGNDEKKASQLDYIPVIISPQSEQILMDAAKKGWAIAGEQNGVKTYLISCSFNIIRGLPYKSGHDYKFNPDSERRMLIKVGVIDKVYTGINLGMISPRSFVNNYLKYYFNHNFNDQMTDYKKRADKKSVLIFSQNKDYWIRYKHDPTAKSLRVKEILQVGKIGGESPKEISKSCGLLQYNQQAISTFNFSKNMPSDWKKNGDLIKNNKIFPVASVALIKGNQFWEGQPWKHTYKYTVRDLLTSEKDPYKQFVMIQGYPITIKELLAQLQIVYKLTVAIFDVISLFSVFIAGTVIIIAMKDFIDSSKREVAMLKALGYTNIRATGLILLPYIIIIVIAFFISLPVSFYGLGLVAVILQKLTGNPFTFTLSFLQWIFLTCFIVGIIILILALAYISFAHSKPLEAIQSTDE